MGCLAGASAEIGVLFMGVTLAPGRVGTTELEQFWCGTPASPHRLLVHHYVGYLAVRGLGGTHQQRAARVGRVALLAVVEIPLVHYSVTLWRSVHQKQHRPDVKLDGLMLFTLVLATGRSRAFVWFVLQPAG